MNEIKKAESSDKHSSPLITSSHRANSSIMSGNTTERKIILRKLTMGNVIDNKPLNYDYHKYGKKIDDLNKPLN